MKKQVILTAIVGAGFAAVAAALLIHPTGRLEAKPEAIDIEILEDGAVAWNGERLTDDAALLNRLEAIAENPSHPELHLKPNRKARYDAVAKVLALVQKQGALKIGFIGNAAPPSNE